MAPRPSRQSNRRVNSVWSVDAGPSVGLDIFSALVGGVTAPNHAFATLDVGGVRGFYRIDVLTGKATLVKPFTGPVIDVAIALALP
jgi:Domain of unknown function (DUF4394)